SGLFGVVGEQPSGVNRLNSSSEPMRPFREDSQVLSEPKAVQRRGDEDLRDSSVAVAQGAASKPAPNIRDSVGAAYSRDTNPLTNIEQPVSGEAATGGSLGKQWWVVAAGSPPLSSASFTHRS